jgi:hypothetical protein
VRRRVTVVRLAGSEIGAEGAIALAAVLPQMASLATLDLGGTSPNHGGVGLVLRAFGMKHALLDLEYFGH